MRVLASKFALGLVAVLLGLQNDVIAGDDWRDVLRLQSKDKAYAVKIGGRLHADIGQVSSDDPQSDGRFEELRRGRLNIAAKLFSDWRLFFEYDFQSDHNAQIKDAYIGYYGFNDVKLKLGNLQAPVSLEEMTSSNAITFMERAMINALVPGYKLGLRANAWGEEWTLSGGLFEGDIRGRDDDVDQGWGISGRATFAPSFEKDNLIHLGISLAYQEPNSDRRIRIRSRPEVHLVDRYMVSTGTLSQVDYTLTSGLEIAAISGGVSLQGEYLSTDVQRNGRPDVTFDGWYLMVSWFLNEGQRNYNYKNGVFDTIDKPKGKFGDWELALRYSTLDLEELPITGGEAKNWTLGLNWYIDRHIRLMTNYVNANADPNSRGERETLEALMFRVQFAW